MVYQIYYTVTMGLNFSSEELDQFAKSYDFHLSTSSPYFPQENSLVEHTVKTIKCLFEKSDDHYLSLLIYRSTPLPWCGLREAARQPLPITSVCNHLDFHTFTFLVIRLWAGIKTMEYKHEKQSRYDLSTSCPNSAASNGKCHYHILWSWWRAHRCGINNTRVPKQKVVLVEKKGCVYMCGREIHLVTRKTTSGMR